MKSRREASGSESSLEGVAWLCSSHVEMPGWRLQEAAREAWGLVRAQPRITLDPLVHVSGEPV